MISNSDTSMEILVSRIIKTCSQINGEIRLFANRIEIDERFPNNWAHSSNGGDYYYWVEFWPNWENTGMLKMVENSSSELTPEDEASIEYNYSIDEMIELVVNLAHNYDCHIVDNR